jgi:REP element-mobilizing transposase RayT
VKYRNSLIQPEWKNELEKYITTVTQNNGHKMIAINAMPDHLHLLVGMRPNQSLSGLMELVKGDSSEWVNKKKLTLSKFYWQSGYGAFCYSKRQVPIIAEYLYDKQEHHRKIGFLEEYKKLLTEFEIQYDDKYIFSEPL